MIRIRKISNPYLEVNIAISPEKTSSGLGGAIYERLREEAQSLEAFGIFFECLPDDPKLYADEEIIIDQNRKRLAFYERFGVRPVTNICR